MHMKIHIYIWSVLLFIITFCSCQKEEENTPPEMPLLELNITNKDIDVDKDSFIVVVTANHNWTIQELPDWIVAHPSSGTEADSVIIIVSENNTTTERTAKIDFRGMDTDVSRTLSIHQLSEYNKASGPLLGIANFTFFKAEVPLQHSEVPLQYSIEYTKLFVNPSISEQIYLGRLLSNKANYPSDIKALNYAFDQITISTSAPVSQPTKTYAPSLNEQRDFAQSIINKLPDQILSFNAGTKGVEFYSLDQLYAIGMVNLGIKLDEIVTGASYKTTTMRKNFGVVYGFRTGLFDLVMDLPDEPYGKEIKPEILAEGVSYISAMDYGRVGLLVVESDYRPKYLKELINKIIEDKPLTSNDLEIINTSNFTHIHFDNNSMLHADPGKLDVITAYKDKMTNIKDTNWYPISFEMTDIKDLTQTYFPFTYKL